MKVFTICAFVALAVSGTQATMSPSDDFGTSARGRSLRSSPGRVSRPAPAPKPAPAPAPKPAPAPAPKHEHESGPEPAPAPAPGPAPAPAPAPAQGGGLSVAAFNVVPGITPAGTGKEGEKDCQQTSCWIATTVQACGQAAADQVQSQLMNGRDAYEVESVNAQGLWVRYWRSEFNPPDRGDIASGSCSDGTPFRVTNCQSTGNVKC